MNASTNVGTDPSAPGRLIDLLSEQLGLYRHLSQLADGQRALITGDQPERLLTILATRQQLIERLESTAAALKPYKAAWSRLREGMTVEQQKTVDRLVSEINAVLAGILHQDAADAELLSARKTATSQAIRETRTARQAGAAYAAATGVSPQSGTGWTDA